MGKPWIGVMPLYDDDKESYWMLPGYMKAIEEAGGIPLMLPLTSDIGTIQALARELDGFLFTGGHDVNPELYHEQAEKVCGTICADRDILESILFQHAVEWNKPAFGICRGLQIFNVLSGGTLYQDLPTQFKAHIQIGHQQKQPYAEPVHEVIVTKDSRLHRILQVDSLKVNSCHHQGIKQLAGKLVAAATAEDGLIEAVVRPDHPFMLAVQWHPEITYPTDEKQFKLFQAFVESCK